MKKSFFAFLTLASASAFAVEVDYSRCVMFTGIQLDHEGRVQAAPYQTIKSQRTEGNTEHLVLESSFGNQKYPMDVSIVRDSQGRVQKITTGGERPSNQMVQQYRDMMVNSAVMMAPYTGSMGMGGYGQPGFMSQEPQYWVRKRNAPAPAPRDGSAAGAQSGSGGGSVVIQGGVVGGMIDSNYEMVPLSRLTREQAQEVGIENVEELNRLRGQWRRDRRTANRLRSSYRQVVDRSALVIPLGSEVDVDIQEGVCLPKSISSRFYNSQSGQVNTFPVSTRENCEKIRNVFRRNERKISECQDVQRAVTQDYATEMGGGMVGGGGSGMYLGPGPVNSLSTSGMMGGIVGGYVQGGMGAGGFMGGMGMGGGFGGAGMMSPGLGYGSDMNMISFQAQSCQWMFDREQPTLRNSGMQSGSSAGASAGSSGSATSQQ